MKVEKRNSSVVSLVVVLLFFIYTLFVPTIGLDMITKLLLDIVFILLLTTIYKSSIITGVKEFKTNWKKYLKTIGIFWLILFISGYVFNGLLDLIFQVNPENNEAQFLLFEKAPLYFAFSTLIFSPIVEELSIRKAFRNMISNKWFYLIVSSLIHSVLYVMFATESLSLLFIIPYFLMAFITAYSFVKYDNILIPISIHLLQNIVSFIMMALYIVSL